MPAFLSEFSLRAYNSFGFEVWAERYCELFSRDDILALRNYLIETPQPLLILGGGSNLLLADRVPGVVARNCLSGFEARELEDDEVSVTLGAGENWHASVDRLLIDGIYGLENLALIPGSVGAAPVQNIGAYGVEVGNLIDAVEVFEWATGSFYWLDAEACRFAYRDSIFKRQPRRYLITSVRFLLSRRPDVKVSYAALRDELRGVEQPGPRAVFDAVCSIRRRKLPDPAVIGNAGSFFKNPVVSEDECKVLRERFPDLVAYPDPEGMKLAAGWLIDRCGWKGRQWQQVGVHTEQALVLVNLGGGSRAQIEALSEQIQQAVRERFGVTLEPEPRFYPAD